MPNQKATKRQLEKIKKKCAISQTNAILGERWMLLLIKEAMLGTEYFEDFLENLGIARNILADRLRKLTQNKVLKTVACPDDARRKKYQLTEKGQALLPLMAALLKWGSDWEVKGKPSYVLVENRTGKLVAPPVLKSSRGTPLSFDDVSLVLGEEF